MNSRNGYRDRLWQTRAGDVDLKIPKLRQSSYFPRFLKPRRTADRVVAAVIQEACLQGVSTRSVDELVKVMGMSGISKSQVSRLAGEILKVTMIAQGGKVTLAPGDSFTLAVTREAEDDALSRTREERAVLLRRLAIAGELVGERDMPGMMKWRGPESGEA